jgi:hypothetical protein
MVSFVIAFCLFVAGNGTVMGQTDQIKAPEPQAVTASHADHANHGAAPSTEKPAGHADHAMSHAGHAMSHTGTGDMKQQEEAMADHMKGMQALMEKISVTASAVERKQLLAEHMAMMDSGVKMMRKMDEAMMMGMMKSGKCPMMEMMSSPQGHEGMNAMMGNMSMCHARMQKKAERNYFMMEQLIESQKQLLQLVP